MAAMVPEMQQRAGEEQQPRQDVNGMRPMLREQVEHCDPQEEHERNAPPMGRFTSLATAVTLAHRWRQVASSKPFPDVDHRFYRIDP